MYDSSTDKNNGRHLVGGVQNPDLRIFDVIMRTEWGTSYNSYLIQGSEKDCGS